MCVASTPECCAECRALGRYRPDLYVRPGPCQCVFSAVTALSPCLSRPMRASGNGTSADAAGARRERALRGRLEAFFKTEAASGVVLLAAAILALALANSPFAHIYENVRAYALGVHGVGF